MGGLIIKQSVFIIALSVFTFSFYKLCLAEWRNR